MSDGVQELDRSKIIIVVPVEMDAKRLPDGYMDTAEAGKFLGIARSTLNRMITDGEIDAIRDTQATGRNGWRWLIPTAEVKRMRKARPFRNAIAR